MVNKCIAPGCKAGYDSSDNKTVISTFRFPADESRRKIWTSRVPQLNWTPSNNSVLCEKHFEESCFKTERNDIKNDRRKQRKGELQRKELKDDAVPTIWPNCPNHLSKTAPLPRTKLTSSSLRSKLDNDRELERLRKEELDCKLDMVKIENIDFISKENQRIFIHLSTNQGNHVVNYALVIEMSLEFNLKSAYDHLLSWGLICPVSKIYLMKAINLRKQK